MGFTCKKPPGAKHYHCYFMRRDGTRFRQSTKQEDKRRAEIISAGWYRRDGDPTYQAANDTTLQVSCGHLLAALKRAKRSAATVGHFYPKKLGHLLRIWGEDMPLSRIDAKLVDGYIATREAEGAKQYTIAKELTALRQLLKHARRRGEFDKELSQVMPIGYGTGYVPRDRRLTILEARSLICELPPNVQRYVAFVCATTARDAAVRRARGRHLLAEGIRVLDRKTKGSDRIVPLNAMNRPFAEFAFAGVGADEPVCPGISSVRHAFDRATKRMGIPHVSPNDLRRSVAHWLLERGVPRDAAAGFMGHANTKMLDAVYGKLDAKELGATINRTLLLEVGSTLEGSWKNTANRDDPGDSVDEQTLGKPCAGTESNRRHGDFQSSNVFEVRGGKAYFAVPTLDESWSGGLGSRSDSQYPAAIWANDSSVTADDVQAIHGSFMSVQP